eukprot:5322847-Amphidinium_carterae.1
MQPHVAIRRKETNFSKSLMPVDDLQDTDKTNQALSLSSGATRGARCQSLRRIAGSGGRSAPCVAVEAP